MTNNAETGPLRLLGDADPAAVCVDGVCIVPQPQADQEQPDEG